MNGEPMYDGAAKADADLNTVLNVPTSLEVGGKTIEIRPFEFGDLPAVMEAAGPLLDDLGKGLAATDIVAQRSPSRLISMLSNNAQHLVPLAVVLSKQPEDWVRKLSLDDAVKLLGVCISVNMVFFATKVTPAMTSFLGDLTKLVTTTGAKPPTTKTEPETPTPEDGGGQNTSKT